MNCQITIDKDVFAIPAGDVWGIASDKLYIIYAPLNGRISLATQENVRSLKECASGNSIDEYAKKSLSLFQAKGNVPVHRIPDTPDDLYQIDILANYTCNFKCIYCYSAAGRSKKEIEIEKIRAVIDYLFCSGKEQKKPYIINFSGGGEPLLSFELIKQTVNYIEQVNKDSNYIYNIGIVTNGSLITPEIIDFFQEHKVDMAVSFEILERLQNKERGSYDTVAKNIDMMLEKGFPFGIRTTFTAESVSCMSEMIDELASRFPKLRKVVYDTVLAPSLFDSPEKLKDYYDTFLDEYWKAKKKGADIGITVESVAAEMLSIVRDRTCQGKIVLTPMGTISSCARVSSPLEDVYDKYIFGNVTEEGLTFDLNRFAAIMSESNIYSQPMCAECFARWNCGGGCRLFHHSFRQDFENVRCGFVRKALRIQLLKVLSDNFKKASGGDLQEFISCKIRNNEI